MRSDQRLWRGMTLVELSVVIIIIGILAAVAIPNMQRTVQQGYWQQAQYALRLIHDGEQRYFDKEDTYYDVNEANPADWRTIYMDDPHMPNIPVTYAVTVIASPPTFLATATDTNNVANQMSIDHDGLLCVDVSIPPNNCGNWPKP